VIAPMLYQVRQGCAEKMEAFVSAGGTFVTTYLSGVVDDTHLCFLNGFPGPLRKLMGVWSEETDVFYPEQSQNIVSAEGNALGLKGSYAVQDYADVIHLEGAESLATYGEDYYQGSAALTVNAFGKGEAYYVASRNDDEFFKDFYEGLTEKLGLKSVLGTVLPVGVSATEREDEQQRFVFVMNFNASAVSVDLGGKEYVNVVSGDGVKGSLALVGNGFAVLKRG
jgi:beta-galactosidase